MSAWKHLFDEAEFRRALQDEFDAGNRHLAIRLHHTSIDTDGIEYSQALGRDIICTALGAVTLHYDPDMSPGIFKVIYRPGAATANKIDERLDRLESTVAEMREALEKLLSEDRK